MFHYTSRKTSGRDVKAPETLESLGSFKVSASVSEAATSHLGQNFERLGLGDMGLESHLGLSSEGLVHIPAFVCFIFALTVPVTFLHPLTSQPPLEGLLCPVRIAWLSHRALCQCCIVHAVFFS